jgi:hypothetical protein
MLTVTALDGVATNNYKDVGDNTGDDRAWTQAMKWRSEVSLKILRFVFIRTASKTLK